MGSFSFNPCSIFLHTVLEQLHMEPMVMLQLYTCDGTHGCTTWLGAIIVLLSALSRGRCRALTGHSMHTESTSPSASREASSLYRTAIVALPATAEDVHHLLLGALALLVSTLSSCLRSSACWALSAASRRARITPPSRRAAAHSPCPPPQEAAWRRQQWALPLRRRRHRSACPPSPLGAASGDRHSPA